ncbi:DUF4326 domain-containing protein [Salipiger manganoxidans]|uniref:DUF4326 domain-containing protein n=1 Tax=Salipiger marinus TaxID=555512 RepID=UPI001E490B81|nr:DUF4326 domain-containing protein [Salipiger manganoxidans]MCD1620099.1 DUF4326 domain-containing protein [Salipiger manganoxidans]
MPRRIQMMRARPWRAEHPEAVNVARPGPFGNPFAITPDRSRAEAVTAFDVWLVAGSSTGPLADQREELRRRLPELRGRDLACWCPLDGPCHADVLLRIANEED